MAALPGFTPAEVVRRLGSARVVDDVDVDRLEAIIDDVSASARAISGLAFADGATGLVDDVIPDTVLAVCCQVAARVYGVPPDESGYSQEAMGAHSRTIGSAAAAGALGFLPAEERALRRVNPAQRTWGRTVQVGSWLCPEQ